MGSHKRGGGCRLWGGVWLLFWGCQPQPGPGAGIGVGGCAQQPLAPLQLLAWCLAEQPNKGPIIFPLSGGKGGGGRDDIKVLAAGSGTWGWKQLGSGEQGLRVTPNTSSPALIAVGIYTLLSHSPLQAEIPAPPSPQQGQGRAQQGWVRTAGSWVPGLLP